MSARYLVRFDDIAPGMNWRVWDQVERMLVARDVKPILAVVPDNRHPALDVVERAPDFWERVRGWQGRGWTIGLHGYQHHYETRDAGIVGLNRESEFAGVPREAQEAKLRAALAIFEREDVKADAWIAPAHSFDATTLELLAAMNVRRISDGFFLWPHSDERGLFWVPQQLWRLRRRPFGVWTVCHHVNEWRDADVARFATSLDAFSRDITDFESVCADFATRRRSSFDALFAASYRRYVFVMGKAGELKRAVRG
jgi:predicted deacetylase